MLGHSHFILVFLLILQNPHEVTVLSLQSDLVELSDEPAATGLYQNVIATQHQGDLLLKSKEICEVNNFHERNANFVHQNTQFVVITFPPCVLWLDWLDSILLMFY